MLGPEQAYKSTLGDLSLLDPSIWFDGLLVPEHMLAMLLYEGQALE